MMQVTSCAQPETWLPVLGYAGHYEVSNHGRIRNCSTGQFLVPAETHGYLHVSLCKDGEIKNHRVHVIVLEAFCGPRPFPGAQACHNDGAKENCSLWNLRWGTAIENQADVARHGRRCQGSDVFGSKLSADDVLAIRRRISAGERNPPIANDFGVSISTIHLIRHNRIWRHLNG